MTKNFDQKEKGRFAPLIVIGGDGGSRTRVQNAVKISYHAHLRLLGFISDDATDDVSETISTVYSPSPLRTNFAKPTCELTLQAQFYVAGRAFV